MNTTLRRTALAAAFAAAAAAAFGGPAAFPAVARAEVAYFDPEPPAPAFSRWGLAWDLGPSYLVAAVSNGPGAETAASVFPWPAVAACAAGAPVVDPKSAGAADHVYVASFRYSSPAPWSVLSDVPGKSRFKPACVAKAIAAALGSITMDVLSASAVTFAMAVVAKPTSATEPHRAVVISPPGPWEEGTAPAAVARAASACVSSGWMSYGSMPTTGTGTLKVVVTDRGGLIAEVHSVTGAAASDVVVRCMKSMLSEAVADKSLPETTVELQLLLGDSMLVEAADGAALRKRLVETRAPAGAGVPPPEGGLGITGGAGPAGSLGIGTMAISRPPSAGSAVKVLEGVVTVSAGLGRDVVRRVVKRNLAAVKYCYEKELMRKPEIKGRVDVQFFIEASGVVALVRIAATTLRDDAVETCIATAVKRLVFPKPEGDARVSVTYPFILVPR